MPELFRIKQIERSEVARLRSENSLLRAALDLNKILLDDSIKDRKWHGSDLRTPFSVRLLT